MDIEKLIEQLRTESLYADKASLEIMDLCMEAATALSTLQAENAQLRESRDHWKRLAHELSEGVNGKDAEHERLQAENEKLRAELEKVKAERDAAVSWAQKYTESIDMPCAACKHNTGDYVCTAICGNCGPMGAESCKWEFDFSGELKED